MATIDRLRAVVRGTGERQPSSASGNWGAVRELTYEPVDRSGIPFDTRAELPTLEGASFVETPLGRTVVVDRVFESDEWHGRVRIDRVLVEPGDLNVLAHETAGPIAVEEGVSRDPAATTTSPVVFVDLETTGLSGGAGTVAFVVGFGWFDGGAFRTRQFLLPGFGGERALLSAASEVIERASGLVTYNGKTFDLPVMETRWLFQRMTPSWEELPHVDLLHLARRLWGRREDGGAMSVVDGGCRLVALEHDLLGVTRAGDVSGWDIPGRYFEFVRHGDARLLAPVLHHNRLDLLSLGCLTARAARLLTEGADGAADGCELVGLGREYLRRGEDARAEPCFRRALQRSDVLAETRAHALYGLARILRRRRDHASAAEIWRELAGTSAARDPLRHEAKEALAVHYEHRLRDLSVANRWAREAVTVSASSRQRERHARRLSRLERKLAVAAALARMHARLPL
jgi:uncharacterized protein YprB with RNaseH-like and TPR domain